MRTLPYGTWPSVISADALTAASPQPSAAQFVDGEPWWSEPVADEGGRVAVFRQRERDAVLPAPWSARSRVHEYGGGAWAATPEGDLLFVEARDQRVWRLVQGGTAPMPLTPADPQTRFGGLVIGAGTRLIAVREQHTGAPVPARDIVEIPLDGSGATEPAAIRSLVAGSDFVAQPRLSPDGTRLAWIAWNHPSMPWDDAELRVGTIESGAVITWTTLSTGAATQAEWTGQDEVTFTDDQTGRWNLYRTDLIAGDTRAIAPADADTGGPLWSLGTRWFAPLRDGSVVAVRTNGTDAIVRIDPDGTVTTLPSPLTADIRDITTDGHRVLAIGASAVRPAGLWLLDPTGGSAAEQIRGGELPWDPAWLPVPKPLEVAGPLGPVHTFDYPPTNPTVQGPDGSLPPYLVLVHGGPTGNVSGALSVAIAYLTSRGIGVLDVNYSGSTGYGRAYRERLRGVWGVADVADALAAARALAEAGIADPDRIAIRGGSAGGLTVLGSLVAGGAFAAGISRYGVADLRALAQDTHDFEAHYLDSLIGPWPEAMARYDERSPLSQADRIRVPVLLLQGSDDPVVPPSQSQAVRDALAAGGIPHAYVEYEGESHGFRRPETVRDAAITELAFLGSALGFLPADTPPLTLLSPDQSA